MLWRGTLRLAGACFLALASAMPMAAQEAVIVDTLVPAVEVFPECGDPSGDGCTYPLLVAVHAAPGAAPADAPALPGLSVLPADLANFALSQAEGTEATCRLDALIASLRSAATGVASGAATVTGVDAQTLACLTHPTPLVPQEETLLLFWTSTSAGPVVSGWLQCSLVAGTPRGCHLRLTPPSADCTATRTVQVSVSGLSARVADQLVLHLKDVVDRLVRRVRPGATEDFCLDAGAYGNGPALDAAAVRVLSRLKGN